MNQSYDGFNLHIEELVLHGFSPGDQGVLGAAIRGELTRLLHDQGVPPALLRSGVIHRIDGVEYTVAPGSTVRAAGAQIAAAIYSGLRR